MRDLTFLPDSDLFDIVRANNEDSDAARQELTDSGYTQNEIDESDQ